MQAGVSSDMGKSGKSEKKGKKGGKKKKGSKTSQEDKMTFAEALLAYQIQMKEAMIEELLAEVKQIEEKNTRYKERNERLRTEQTGHVKELLGDAKAQERELAKKEIVNREQVDELMKEKWEFIREKENLLEEIRNQISHLEKQITLAKTERDYWLEYKNVGSPEHAKQIHLLQEEIGHMAQNFTEINEHFNRNLKMTKEKIEQETERKMDMTREMATLDAVKHIDLESQKEIQENEWMKKEVAIYSKDIQDLEANVYKTEQENLQLISHLFNCRLQDLKISRNVFLTQMVGLDPPEEDTTSDGEGENRHLPTPEDRDSALSLDLKHLHEDAKDFKEYLHLGPLELKLLSIEGQAVPTYTPGMETKNQKQREEQASENKLKWPVTPKMIKSAFPP
ncbi:coiled-coil domain-containing protein 83 isoform X2 [Pyxicephalus adspersus]|uniref:coiled-coil domain-containing protein 83 isoform X2 n=1 Tax=Pyxicephalus adspersus TaxID=30357 RepID=UPI003B58C76B